eukprot:XP_001693594.1 predicted protein [Chlamydomonas reinhardtii]
MILGAAVGVLRSLACTVAGGFKGTLIGLRAERNAGISRATCPTGAQQMCRSIKSTHKGWQLLRLSALREGDDCWMVARCCLLLEAITAAGLVFGGFASGTWSRCGNVAWRCELLRALCCAAREGIMYGSSQAIAQDIH